MTLYIQVIKKKENLLTKSSPLEILGGSFKKKAVTSNKPFFFKRFIITETSIIASTSFQIIAPKIFIGSCLALNTAAIYFSIKSNGFDPTFFDSIFKFNTNPPKKLLNVESSIVNLKHYVNFLEECAKRTTENSEFFRKSFSTIESQIYDILKYNNRKSLNLGYNKIIAPLNKEVNSLLELHKLYHKDFEARFDIDNLRKNIIIEEEKKISKTGKVVLAISFSCTIAGLVLLLFKQ